MADPTYAAFKEYHCAMVRKRSEIDEGYEQLPGEKGLKEQKIISSELEYLRKNEESLRLIRNGHWDEHKKWQDDHKKNMAQHRINMDADLKDAHKVLHSIDNIVNITITYIKTNDIYESELKKIDDEDNRVSAANSEIMGQIEKNNLKQIEKRNAFNELHKNN
jgi:hypothetical protein